LSIAFPIPDLFAADVFFYDSTELAGRRCLANGRAAQAVYRKAVGSSASPDGRVAKIAKAKNHAFGSC
jgi:hypothetical protein